MRHLRLMVLDAHGEPGITLIAKRASAVALLADAEGEPAIADILTGMSQSLQRGWHDDPRVFIYKQLDRLPGAQRVH